MPEKKEKSWLASGLLYLTGVALVIVAWIGVSRLKTAKAKQVAGELHQETATAQAGPPVNVVIVGATPAVASLTLLGETHPYLESTLYAKVSGYLKTINVDKGDVVQANQVLAVIESPETDAQYRAAVINAQNLSLIAQRDLNLAKRDMIAQQDADTAEANARVAEQDAENLATLKSYEIIRAPFTGKITARYADPGALVQAATSSQTTALPVVRISETDRERVYIYPDQHAAAAIRVGDTVEIHDPAKPGVSIAARVTRVSGEFDVNTRTMLTEIDFDNRENLIPPGSFVQVTLRSWNRSRYLQIPAQALVLRGTKTFVAVVGQGNRVSYQPVVVANDDGAHADIRSGLAPGERIAVNIPSSVPEGGKIRPVAGIAP